MSAEEEQAMELEALQAILMDDLQEHRGERPVGWPKEGIIWRIFLSPAEDVVPEEDDDSDVLGEMLWMHTASYPTEPPLYRLRNIRGLRDAELTKLGEIARNVVDESMGSAMIFNIVSAVKDWLRSRAEVEEEEDEGVLAKRREAEEEQRRQAARATGTPVTPENFRVWREKFDAEMRVERAKSAEFKLQEAKANRLTGRQWFEQNRAVEDMSAEEAALLEGEEEGEGGGEEDDFISAYLARRAAGETNELDLEDVFDDEDDDDEYVPSDEDDDEDEDDEEEEDGS